MPFLITATRPERWKNAGWTTSDTDIVHVVTRRAVLTLDEARERLNLTAGLAEAEQDRAAERLFDQIDALTAESGGTVGPLPDGTEIEVTRASLNDLRITDGTLSMSPAEVIANYNEREAQR